MKKTYVPDRGDLVWLDFDPKAGHEQSGRRPALILSPRSYNQAAKLALACPITSQVKGYPFEVHVSGGKGIRGVVLADQVKSVDWRERRAERSGAISAEAMTEVRGKLAALLGFREGASA